MSSSISGTLKQQCEDGNGDYEWHRRSYVLEIPSDHLLIVSPDGSSTNKPISLQGALYSKAWSISSASVGYGFDIVWSNGSIISFLATEEKDCQAWVNSINACIQMATGKEGGVSSHTTSNNADDTPNNDRSNQKLPPPGTGTQNEVKPPLYPAPIAGQSVSSSLDGECSGKKVGDFKGGKQHQDVSMMNNETFSDNDTTINNGPLSQSYTEKTNTRPPLHNSESPLRDNASPATVKKYASFTGSAQKLRSRSRSASPISEISESMNMKISRNDGMLNASSLVSSVNMSHDNINNDSMDMDMNNHNNKNNNYHHIFPENASENDYFQLKQKCIRLHAKAEREAMDAQVAREQLVKLQAEIDAIKLQHSRDLAQAMEKEKLAMSGIDTEVEMRVLKASNDNAAFHDAAMKLEREQSARELTCLKEDLESERKRYASLLKKETDLKKRAEDHEIGLQQEITNLREKFQKESAEVKRLNNIMKADTAHWERERKILAQEATNRANELEKERNEQSTNAQLELRKKLSELNLQFDSRVKEIETHIKETVKQEEEGIRQREIAAIERRCEKDIQEIRTEERKSRAREIHNIKNNYRENERQTAEDLAQLEKLHSERVNRLEEQVSTLKGKLTVSEKVATNAKVLANKGSVEVRKQASLHLKQAEEAMARVEQLTEQLTIARREIQESKVRENTYRDQLSKSLEDGRIQRAELLEAKKMASENAADAFHWKKVAQESDKDHSLSALTIAREEITIIEHELNRVKKDNHVLQVNLARAEKLVYGAPNEYAPRGSLNRAYSASPSRLEQNSSGKQFQYDNHHHHEQQQQQQERDDSRTYIPHKFAARSATPTRRTYPSAYQTPITTNKENLGDGTNLRSKASNTKKATALTRSRSSTRKKQAKRAGTFGGASTGRL